MPNQELLGLGRCRRKYFPIVVLARLQFSNPRNNSHFLLPQEGRKMGYNGLQGIPMIASSPVRHDSPLNFHGVEITSFQPPWKALSDFALHADLDNNGPVNHTPAFQHLMNQVSVLFSPLLPFLFRFCIPLCLYTPLISCLFTVRRLENNKWREANSVLEKKLKEVKNLDQLHDSSKSLLFVPCASTISIKRCFVLIIR